MASVTISKLDKTYSPGKKDQFRAVKGIDLEIRDKEFMVLVGPSGCGKSTTLRMIAGLEEITGGTLKIGEQIMNDVEPKNRGIAMVFQNYALYPHMTLFDNMAFGLKLKKVPRDEIKKRVDDAAETLGLTSMLDRKPKALSGGQRQRVAVGRAIVRNPDVFLFDEPLSNLDAKMRVQMRAEISKLHTRLDATMIYVTHDQVEAMTMGDRICVMKDGNIMQVDEPLNIYNKPANVFTAGFIGSPPMNFFNGLITKNDGKLGFASHGTEGHKMEVLIGGRLTELAEPRVGKEIIFGIRPEGMEVSDTISESSIQALVEHAEPMGAETMLYLSTKSNDSFIAKVAGHYNYKIGAHLHLTLNMDEAHLFDAETEDSLLFPYKA
ncbi:sn-glycerol-3-phosphate ABC transporter ATP-binding protein UgpC [Coraliomargarita algicola]|uniref:Sn-glycerol-3-phosphate ABC transporter ATP-binding protein UgpC n=1 Tax=Coraliomargarita algicola TaxID=3092156 RepID=A0ABZ0RIF3_9BACT|nr:sn-glycerol-3-phosphate ABC transporter ATP-binding protein UgpC [Coraliomargarita sp. J2-16]WPJ95837.1 sn-glycerol-3-phosphate ABC transporter ATP-binding protein UgpC [Coraliomargarita sp. J2-16]